MIENQIDKKHVEALLFVAKEPLTIQDIAKHLKEDERVVLRWITELEYEYKERGILIRKVAGGFEMVSSPECHEAIEALVPKEYINDLSNAQLQTITIVALFQPATRATIGQMREVKNPDEAIQRLVEKQLIKQTEKGYVTTDHFLKFFGINDLKELPKALEKANTELANKTKKKENSEEDDEALESISDLLGEANDNPKEPTDEVSSDSLHM